MSGACDVTRSPFQATKLWNQMIRDFRKGIELKKRRWKMRSYEKTFYGSDAVDWFLLYLRSNQKFGNHVTRAQSKQLLQKFLENKIFEDARGKEGKIFEDDNHLYRFTEKADQIHKTRGEIATQRSVTNLIRSVSMRKRNPNNLIENEDSEITSPNHGCNKVIRSQSMPKAPVSPRTNNVPPQTTGLTPLAENLTDFQIDSTKKSSTEKRILSKKFNSSTEEQVSENITDEKENIPAMLNIDESIESHYCSILDEAGINNRAFIVEQMSPLVSTFSRTRSLRDPRSMKYRHKFVLNCDEEESVYEPNLNFYKSIRRSRNKRPKSNQGITGLAFAKMEDCESPTKKIKMDRKLKSCSSSSHVTMLEEKVKVDISESTSSTCSDRNEPRRQLRSLINDETSTHWLQDPLQNKCKTDLHESHLEDTENFFKNKMLNCLGNALELNNLDDLVNLSVLTEKEIRMNISTELKSAEIPEWVLSAMKFLVQWPERVSANNDANLPAYEGFEVDVFRAIEDHYESSLKEPLLTFNMFKLIENTSVILTRNKKRSVEILQYLCLIIPQWNRKQIYLLLRFMDRISNNVDLKLSKDLPNKELVVRSFSSALVKNKELSYHDKDRMTSIRITSFLLENHEKILTVPKEWKDQLDQVIAKKSTTVATKTRSLHCITRDRPVSYCVQVSSHEYAKQKEDSTRKALWDLLNMIANDDTLPPKIKRKRLKEFKKNYPEIYQRKFPEDNISTCSTTSQRTLRIRQAIRPFFFSKNHSSF